MVDISRCLSIKGAEDVINRAHAFELSTHSETMFFIADSDKVTASNAGTAVAGSRTDPSSFSLDRQEKEEWISSVGRAIVRQSKR